MVLRNKRPPLYDAQFRDELWEFAGQLTPAQQRRGQTHRMQTQRTPGRGGEVGGGGGGGGPGAT
eukprot:8587303-Lingulodinium_polyedra.AAC.1